MALVRALLPEGQRVYLREKGIEALPLHALNTLLAPHGLMIQATKGRDPKKYVECMDQQGRAEQYGLFALVQIQSEPSGRESRKRRRGR